VPSRGLFFKIAREKCRGKARTKHREGGKSGLTCFPLRTRPESVLGKTRAKLEPGESSVGGGKEEVGPTNSYFLEYKLIISRTKERCLEKVKGAWRRLTATVGGRKRAGSLECGYQPGYPTLRYGCGIKIWGGGKGGEGRP